MFDINKFIFRYISTFLQYKIASFLMHVIFFMSSSPKTTPSGLPQGAVLSTTLFALYISDLPYPPKTQLALYADDTAILAQSWRTDTTVHRLTHASSVLLRYFTKWEVQVNIHKTEAIFFTRHRPVSPAPLHFQYTVIPWNSQVRYLGLLLDPKLLFTRHLISLTYKATGIFLQLFPLLARDSKLSISNKITLYNYLSALCSHKLPLFGATHNSPTTAVCKFYSPNVSASLATTPGAPHPNSSYRLKRRTYP
jgi:hypothetical protein